MNKYEAMIIFPDSLKDEALEAAFEKVRGEIEKAGGKVENATRMGRRTFARPLKKHASGQYAVFGFQMDGTKISGLQARLRLSEDVFRVQIMRAVPVSAPKEPAAAG